MNWIIILIVIVVGFFGAVASPAPEPVTRSSPDCAVEVTEGPRKEATPEPACAPAVSAWAPVDVNGIEGVIVGEADGWMLIDNGGLYWTPTLDDLEAAEAAIAETQGELDQRRQYVGFTEDGVAKVYINGFCDDLGSDWLTNPIVVDDGGDCFFSAVYNTETSELEWFTFNGDA